MLCQNSTIFCRQQLLFFKQLCHLGWQSRKNFLLLHIVVFNKHDMIWHDICLFWCIEPEHSSSTLFRFCHLAIYLAWYIDIFIVLDVIFLLSGMIIPNYIHFVISYCNCKGIDPGCVCSLMQTTKFYFLLM